jgi:hypothetical protein
MKGKKKKERFLAQVTNPNTKEKATSSNVGKSCSIYLMFFVMREIKSTLLKHLKEWSLDNLLITTRD